MIRHARHAGAEPDIAGHGQRLCDEEVGRGYVFPCRGEVLADPCLQIAEAVQVNNLVQVVLKGFRKIGPRRVQGHHEAAQFHKIESSLGKSATIPATGNKLTEERACLTKLVA